MSTKCRLRTKHRIVVSILIAVSCLGAADPFEAAAIHPEGPNSTANWINFLPAGRLSISGITIRNLIWLAWQLPPERVTGGPKWLDVDKYSIEAKTWPGQTLKDQAGWALIQTLLADRFQLKTHRESKLSAAYDLSIAAGGIKLQKDGDPVGKGSILPWGMFVTDLSRRLGRPVVDKTNLTGAWFFDLRQLGNGGDDAGASIISGVREFGLKLDSTKTAVELLVIDSIERPTPN